MRRAKRGQPYKGGEGKPVLGPKQLLDESGSAPQAHRNPRQGQKDDGDSLDLRTTVRDIHGGVGRQGQDRLFDGHHILDRHDRDIYGFLDFGATDILPHATRTTAARLKAAGDRRAAGRTDGGV